MLVAGCGEDVVVEADPAGPPYDGPMYVELDHRDRASPLEASGAAGLALECATKPSRGGGAGYDDGLVEVQDSPQDALANWLEDEFAPVPEGGYRVERADGGRVLLSWDVGEQTKAAVVVSDDVTDYRDETGWGVEAWASCDPAELGGEAAAELGVELWQDPDGRPVPTTDVTSHRGPEHCDWQDVTWLRVGQDGELDEDFDEYLSGDDDGQFADYLTSTPDDAASLPRDATDTGWQRDGRELWLGERPRAAYLVSLDDPSDVERWPATRKPILCE